MDFVPCNTVKPATPATTERTNLLLIISVGKIDVFPPPPPLLYPIREVLDTLNSASCYTSMRNFLFPCRVFLQMENVLIITTPRERVSFCLTSLDLFNHFNWKTIYGPARTLLVLPCLRFHITELCNQLIDEDL